MVQDLPNRTLWFKTKVILPREFDYLQTWKNSKEDEVRVGKAKSPLGAILREGSREELSCVPGILLQLLDKNDRSILPSSAFFKNQGNTINAQQYSTAHVRGNHLLIIF